MYSLHMIRFPVVLLLLKSTPELPDPLHLQVRQPVSRSLLFLAMLASGLTLDEIPCGKYGTLDKYVPDGDYIVLKFAPLGI